MSMRARALCALAAACLLAGCATPTPFTPAAVRFARVDYLKDGPSSAEALAKADAPGILLRLDRDTVSPTDEFVASVIIEPARVGRKLSARLTIIRGDDLERARLDIPDVRSTRLDVHVELRGAAPGPYLLRVEMDGVTDDKLFTVR